MFERYVKGFFSCIENCKCESHFFGIKHDVNRRRRKNGSNKILFVGLGKILTEPFKMISSSVKLYCRRVLMILMAWAFSKWTDYNESRGKI